MIPAFLPEIMETLFRLFSEIKGRGTAGQLKKCNAGGLRVSYGHADWPGMVPDISTILGSGGVKYQYLDAVFPHAGAECSLLYAVSSQCSPAMNALMRVARQYGIPVVWNQNGAYFPSAYGAKVARLGNRQMASLLHGATHVLYQSRFAKQASDYFLGERKGPWEVLYNAVDTTVFSRQENTPRASEIVLLAAGSHNDSYRLPLALQTLKELEGKCRRGFRLLVAGRMAQGAESQLRDLASKMGVLSRVEIRGPYSQQEAPAVFSRADILLHTQYNDVCPSVVLEAMACGLPVAYSSSGGTPELVGDAGVGIPSELDWFAPRPPGAGKLAAAVVQISRDLECYRMRARYRAETKFDLKNWITRHREVFSQRTGSKL